jgi:cytochrome c5
MAPDGSSTVRFRVRRKIHPQRLALAALAAMACAAAPVGAQEPGFRGVDIFDSACYACHAEGIDGAPRIGDRAAWSARAEKGLDALTENALKGVRGMPPHGGNSSLTRLQLERAIVYMVNASGGDWVEPPDPRPAGSERSGAQVYQQHCALCHATGFDNAPRIGDRAAWLPYTKLGLDPMVRTAIRGHGAMPPRGGKANLTDAELRDAVIYMISAEDRRGPKAGKAEDKR